jgi:hypothetical protein
VTAWQLGRHLGRGVGTASGLAQQRRRRLCGCAAAVQCLLFSAAPQPLHHHSASVGRLSLSASRPLTHTHPTHTIQPMPCRCSRSRSGSAAALSGSHGWLHPRRGPGCGACCDGAGREWGTWRQTTLAAPSSWLCLLSRCGASRGPRFMWMGVSGGVWPAACSLLCYVPWALLLCACVLLACMCCVGLVRRTTLGAPSAHLTHAPPPPLVHRALTPPFMLCCAAAGVVVQLC